MILDIAPTELLVLGVVAILVIPPKDLPKAMRVAGYWVGRARGAAQQFRSGFDNMVREAELAEMEKRWAAENERIMREHPPSPAMLPLVPQPFDPADTPTPDVTADGSDAPVALAPRPALTHATEPAGTPAPPATPTAP